MKKNGIFIIADSLRYDVLSDPVAARALTPNLSKLIERGFLRRVIANAQATQFVVPTLFSQTYPLDYGGYNNGIRERPASFNECLQDAGYETHYFACVNQLGVTMSFDRGFKHIHAAVDYRSILSYRIDKTLSYEFELADRGEKSEAEAYEVVASELTLIFDGIREAIKISQKSTWPRQLKKANETLARACETEKELLTNHPGIVLEKLRTLSPKLYCRFLGEDRISPLKLFKARAAESIDWRSRRFLERCGFPYIPQAYCQIVAKDALSVIVRALSSFKRPWHIYFHFMDIHDCTSFNRPLEVLRRYKFLPQLLRARRKGLTKRRYPYDLAVMAADEQIGLLVEKLRQTDQLEETVILVTSDHGDWYSESPRGTKKTMGLRMHYENIEVPLVLAGGDRQPSDEGLVDSMGVTASFLDALNVSQHSSFKGKSVFGPGRRAVISENAGRGNADVTRRDLYFSVTSPTHKLMAILHGNQLELHELYDLKSDPKELKNILRNPNAAPIVDGLLQQLFDERKELLAMRGARIDDIHSPPAESSSIFH